MKPLLILLTLLCVACGEKNHQVNKGIDLYDVDSCQYVVFSGVYKGGIVHHNNCKYCKYRTKDTIK